MKKRRFISCVLALAMSVSVCFPNNLKAQAMENEGLVVNLGEFSMVTPDYNENEVIVQTIENTADVISVNIVDKETGNVLETITSTNIPKNSPALNSIISKSDSNFKASSASDTFYYTIQRDITDPLVTVRLQTVVVLYKSGSFSEVKSIEGTSMFPISSSSATLENVSTYARSATGTLPTAHVEYLGSGVITITTTKTKDDQLSIGLSIAAVNSYGYTVTKSTTETVYLRKQVTIQGDFYTYSNAN